MEQTNNTIAMLKLMNQAAFCVKDGKIIGANTAALQHNIEIGTEILSLLETGKQEYEEFTEGCLYLTLRLSNIPLGASVTRMEDVDIFLLEPETDRSDLQVMALAAQELRQPLSNVMAIADSLFPAPKDDLSPELQEQTSRINRGLFQMLRIISNMSDAYRYQQDTPTQQEAGDICSMIDELFQSAIPLVAHTGLELTYTGLHESIYCLIDHEKLERAVSNLLSNAIKFSPKGGKINAKLSRKGKMLYLTIQDSGSGIEESVRSSIYDRFHRTPGIEDSRYGIGLGMVLIRAAATAHGGTVLMEQNPDWGTRLTMTFSIRQGKGLSIKSHMYPKEKTTEKRHILQVDYAGERDHRLLEFSEILPADLY